MKKIYTALMKILHATIILLVVLSLCILLYALLGPGKKKSVFVEKQELPEVESVVIEEPIEEENSVVEEVTESETVKVEEPKEFTNITDEEKALAAVGERLKGTGTLKFQGLQDVGGKNYYVFTMLDGEGIFYVDGSDGEVYYSDSETGELKVLEPVVEDYTPVDTTGYILGDQLRIDGNCIRLKDFYHGMSFRDAMNLILTRAGINEDIMSYDEVIYNTTSYNSTDGEHSIYDNIEISSRMGNYYFEGMPVKLYLRFDRPVGGDIEMTKEERMLALVKEVRLRFVNNSETMAMQAEEELMHDIRAVLGEPVKVEALEQMDINKYIWYVGNDMLMLLYRTYDAGEGQEQMILDYMAVVHREAN